MLSLKEVTKGFSGHLAVDRVSFNVAPGEVVGFLGPNGAGKTTTMRMIASLLEPDAGEILLDGQNIQIEPLFIKRRLGFMPENNPLYQDMLVFEYLDFVASAHRLKSRQKQQALTRAVEETGISQVYSQPIGELSKGYKQRVGLAAAIIHQPDILILDEPQEGLDPNQRTEIRKLIKKLGTERTVILSTHVLPEVTAVCDRVIIINKGRIVADAAVDELTKQAEGKCIITLGAVGLTDTASLQDLPEVEAVRLKIKQNDQAVYELTATGDKDLRLTLFDLAKENNWRIFELHQETLSLEEVFKKLTKD